MSLMFRELGLCVAMGLAAGCGDDGSADPVEQTAQVRLWAVPTPPGPQPIIDGSMTLRRYPDRVEFESHLTPATGLIAGHVYTTWLVILNDPSKCMGGALEGGSSYRQCGQIDIVGTNATAAKAGAGNIGGDIAPAGNWDQVGQGVMITTPGVTTAGMIIGDGIYDTMAAEINVAIRDHGPALTGAALNLQKTDFVGGCDVYACEDMFVGYFKVPQ